VDALVDLVYRPRAEWEEHARKAFDAVLRERYPYVKDLVDRRNDERRFQLRVNSDPKDNAVPYAALIPPGQELSGPYGGMSFVMFPADEEGAPALVCMGVGTHGLAPDEAVLGKPGHARKVAAITAWLNTRRPGSAWAKRDPVRIDQGIPVTVRGDLGPWAGACKPDKYGRVLYATFVPPARRTSETDKVVRDALAAFIDLFFAEREILPKKTAEDDAERLRRAWLSEVMPTTDDGEVHSLLQRRRFVVLQGPPGTGKTELATRLLADRYKGRGRVIQFHPGTTYESFVGGLAPKTGGAMGFTFEPVPGHLMDAAREASQTDAPYLLVVDEINRADLAKVLGEAIHLFEPLSPNRKVQLAHDFEGWGREFSLPKNLHVLGTMNSADRSIAILDIAVRRRFSFVSLWPQLSVVEEKSGPRLRKAFNDLLTLFVEHAADDALQLLPGHGYFLGSDADADARLRTEVRPLLEEYLAQGYVAGFADEVRAYIDRIGATV